MKIKIENDRAEWVNEGSKLAVDMPGICQALFDANAQAVVLLCRGEGSDRTIHVYSPNGSKMMEIGQPDDCFFNYIGPNRGHDVAVMAKVYMSGWTDWWYGIDPKSGQLVSLGEGR